MTTIEALTITALFVGPILAVLVTRIIDFRRSKRERRLDVFRTLMRTRRTPVSPEHVTALNLVEIEYQGVRSELTAWEELFRHFTLNPPRHRDEEVNADLTREQKSAREDRYNQRVQSERDQLLAKLLHAMAKFLGYRIEQIDILSRGYYPQALSDIDLQQYAVRHLLTQMSLGKRGLPVEILTRTEDNTSPGQGEKALLPNAAQPDARAPEDNVSPLPGNSREK